MATTPTNQPDPVQEALGPDVVIEPSQESQANQGMGQETQDQATPEPVNKPEDNVVEDGSTRTGLHPVDLNAEGVGGDYTIAPGGGAGAGSGPVDAFGNAIHVDRGLDPTSEEAKATSQKQQQHPVDPKAARTEDPSHYQPYVREARDREVAQKRADEAGAPIDRMAPQQNLSQAVPDPGVLPPTE